MDFLTQEVIEKAGLTEDQLATIKPVADSYIADLKKSWDGKANENAEGVLAGAANKVAETTKINRNTGEKIADYIARAGSEYVNTTLSSAKAEYEQKLKDFDGNNATKAELDAAKAKLDEAQRKLAELEPLAEKAGKYDELATKYDSMKLQTAFTSVKPSFSSEANEYEVKAKWQEFVDGVQAKYKIEMVDGEAVAIDKENEYKQTKLKDLVNADENIKGLITGRQQAGSGAKTIKAKPIEGIPFEISESANSSEIRKSMVDYLTTKEGLSVTSAEYSKRFAELWAKIPKK